MTTISPELLRLCSIAHAAGREIMQIYQTDFASSTKNDASPVTEADQRAEELILKELASVDPSTPAIGEESCAAGRIPSIGRRFYLVDPLDGTKEFINRNGEFTVNIGLIEDQNPVAGVVYAPAIGELYAAMKGQAFAAYCNVETSVALAQWRKLSMAQTRPEKLIGIASRSHRDAETETYLRDHEITEIISAGSSLKFCTIAAGRAHVYPRFGRTMEWDTAAGHAILAAAGGHVRDASGSALTYGKSSQNFANPSFIASAF
jgi:3'(2'), 5'-bisphosphate nucleotidase